MDRIVFISGIWNIVLGAGLLVPAIYEAVGMHIPNPFWGWILCGFLWFTSAVLLLAAKDLKQRGSFVYWEGILRLIAGTLLLTIGPLALGWPAWFIGGTDLAWALIYAFGLPRSLGTTHKKLLLDDLTSASVAKHQLCL